MQHPEVGVGSEVATCICGIAGLPIGCLVGFRWLAPFSSIFLAYRRGTRSPICISGYVAGKMFAAEGFEDFEALRESLFRFLSGSNAGASGVIG